MSLFATVAAIVFVPLAPAAAQTAPADPNAPAAAPATDPSTAQRAHTDRDQAIVVTGVRRRAEDVLGGVSVLDEAELNRAVEVSKFEVPIAATFTLSEAADAHRRVEAGGVRGKVVLKIR